MTSDSLSTRAARLLEQLDELGVDNSGNVRVPCSLRDDLSMAMSDLLAELTAAEAERDKLKAEHNEASTRAAYTIIALIAERDRYKDQFTAAREALRQIADDVDARYDSPQAVGLAQMTEAALGPSAVPQEKP